MDTAADKRGPGERELHEEAGEGGERGGTEKNKVGSRWSNVI